MKLYFTGHDYKYAAEQMLLTLFPAERPEYPEKAPEEGDHWAKLALFQGKTWMTAVAELCVYGKHCRRLCRTRAGGPGEQPADGRHILKMAFYRAATQLLGDEPPWGALSGVRPVKLPTKAMENGATPAQAEAILRTRYRVSAPRSKLAMDCALACMEVKAGLRAEEISVYVGIPFCPSRCAYCSFISSAVGSSLKLMDSYLDTLLLEIDAAGRAAGRAGRTVKAVYIGGGTPTTLSAPQLSALQKRLHTAFDLSRCTEFTVEAGRPDTITGEKLRAIGENGGNRISVNPQSMSDEVLRAIGRAHTAGEFLTAWELVRAAGIPCVNTDLIAGLPGDTVRGFCRSLDTILSLAPENITVHTLALKKGSRLMQEGGALPDGKAVADMLEYAWDALRKAGYRPYYLYRQKFMSGSFENVGWCRPGFPSVYNICMMEELHTILSLGAGGVTKLTDPAKGSIVRVANPKFPQEYIRDRDRIVAEKEHILSY